jgi:tetratricopeptide (TPR) repeat protein
VKAWLTRIAAAVLAAGLAVLADGTDDEYVRIYNQIQQADLFAQSGRANQARERYHKAREALQSLQKREPTWNPRVVEFRLRYLAGKLAALPADPVPAPTDAGAQPAPAARPSEPLTELAALQERVRQLEADKILLTARLREALAAQPAAVDPRELAKAEEKIKTQQKEIELLRGNLQRAEAESPKRAEPAALESSQRALAQARQELATQSEKLATLTREKEGLQTLLRSFTKPGDAQALRQENAQLKAQIEEVKSLRATAVAPEELQQRLTALQTALGEEQSRAELLRAEKRVLERRISELSAQHEAELTAKTQALREALATAHQEKAVRLETNQALRTALAEARSGAPSAAEHERDALRRKFDAVSRELLNRRMQDRTAEFERLTNELASLKARLDTLEARKAPDSQEELALFRAPTSAAPRPSGKRGKSSLGEPSTVSSLWTASADRARAKPRAERADDAPPTEPRAAAPDVSALANLAAGQLEQHQLDQAEATLKQALATSPRDAAGLSLLGRLRYQQERIDEALEALSQSAQLDPQNAETYNYLGLTLSRKGLRDPAESALRRAVQLSPAYASAHHNLAVVYATQQPPSIELARHHYQKARAAGEPADVQLEKLLAGTGAASPTP